jgi:hypothetical protein
MVEIAKKSPWAWARRGGCLLMAAILAPLAAPVLWAQAPPSPSRSLQLRAAPAEKPKPATTTPRAATFDGAVLADGKPAAQARVALRPLPSTRGALHLAWLDGAKPATPVAETATDAAGAFRLDLPGDGFFRVEVAAEGRPAMTRLVGPPDLPRLQPVALPVGVALDVRVLDAAGKPISGARLRLDAAPGARAVDPFQWHAATVEAVTDAEGRARLLRPADGQAWLVVVAPGHPPRRLEVRGAALEVALAAGRRLAVEVRDERRRPAANIVLLDENGVPLTRTDAGGKADLVLATEARRVAAFDAEGRYADEAVPASGPLRLQLAAPRTLAGRAIDAATRLPLAGAWVWQASEAPAAVRSDGDGLFRLVESPIEPDRVLAAAAGYWTGSAEDADRYPTEVVVALAPAASLEGRVVDPRGQGIAGVRLQLVPHFGNGRPRFGSDPRTATLREAVSDAQGAFRFPRVTPGLALELSAFKSPAAPAALEIAPLAPQEVRGGVAVTLTPGVAAVGLVVDDAQRPIAGAAVQLLPAARLPPEEIPAGFTGEDGLFRVAGLAPGRYDLVARAAGRSKVVVPGILVPPEGGEQDLGTVTLPPALELVGRVEDAEGRPLAGATVAYHADVHDSLSWRRQTMLPPTGAASTAADGGFVIGGLGRGEQVALTASMAGHASLSLVTDALPLAEPLLLTLAPAARLAGTVVDGAGNPVPSARLMAMAEETTGRRPLSVRADERGRFAFEDLAAGVYQLHVSAQDFQNHTISGLEARAGGGEEIEIVLQRGGVVEGVVLGPDGEPVPDVAVHAGPPGARRGGGHRVSSDAAGRYRLGGLPAGDLTVRAEHPTLGSAAQAVRLEGVGPVRADLRFTAAGVTVSGTVVDADGVPVAGATVSLRATDAWRPTTVDSAADGSFEVRDVRPGSYVLAAEKGNAAPAALDAPLQVAGEPVAGLELRLRRGVLLRGTVRGLELDDLAKVQVAAFQKDEPSVGSRRSAVAFDGTFTLGGLAPGAVHVMATLESRGLRATADVQLAADQLEAQVELVFQDGAGILSGLVLLDGRPLAAVEVSVHSNDSGFARSQSTGGDGRYRIEGIPSGSAMVMVAQPRGRFLARRDVQIEGDAVADFELRSARVRGRVIDAATREGLEGAALTFMGDRVLSDSRGQFNLSVLVDDTEKTLRVQRDGYLQVERELALAPEQVLDDLEIALEAAAGLIFAALTPTGPATAVSACLDRADGVNVTCGQWAADADGLFRIAVAAPGSYQLTLQATGTVAGTFQIAIPNTNQAPLRLQAGGLVQVTVPALVASGAPGQLMAWSADGQAYRNLLGRRGETAWATLLTAGQATLRLPAGLWRLEVRQGEKRYQAQAAVADGATIAVELK